MAKTFARKSKLDDYRLNKLEQAFMFYRQNPVEIIRDIFGKEPTWYQRITFKDLWDKPFVVLKWGRGACYKYDNLLYLADTGEYTKIGELCNQNIKVLSMDEKYKLVKADALVSDNGVKECFKISLKSGRSIEVTAEHPLYTANGWEQTKNLRSGIRVAVARQMPHITRTSVGKAKARLLGYLIGDGSIIRGIGFTNANDIILDNFKTCVNNGFGNYNLRSVQKSKATTIYVTNNKKNEILSWLRKLDLWGKNSHNKFVPNCVYGWSLEDISNFIGAYFDCDGTVSKSTNRISISSVSEELLKGIQRLLLKFEILSSIKKENTTWVYKGIRKRSIAYNLNIYGRDNINRFAGSIESIGCRLNILRNDNIKTNPNNDTVPKEIWKIYQKQHGVQLRSRQHSRSYRDKYAPSREKLKRFGEEFKINDAVLLANSDIFWDEIISIISIGNHKTYNVEVPEYHNFVADTIITHNSKTSTVAWYLVAKSMFFGNVRSGIIAPSYRQAQFVFDEIDDLFSNSPFVRRSCSKAPSRSNDKSILRFHSKSSIEALPIGTQGAKIRGRRYSIVLLDEAAQIDGDTIGMVIMPMLSNMREGRRNQIISASSPFFPEAAPHFYESCLQHRDKVLNGNDDYHYSSYNFIDTLLDNNPNFKPDISFIERALEMSPEDIFMMEWLGIFPGETHGFFSTQLIESCTPRGLKEVIAAEYRGETGCKYVMGIDPARSPKGDLFSISIFKVLNNGIRHIVKIITHKGIRFPDMATVIRNEIFLHNFNVVAIYMDSRGGGRELQDLLDTPWEFNGVIYPAIIAVEDDEIIGQSSVETKSHELRILRMVDFNTVAINDMYFKFKSLMEQGKILFPIDMRRHEDMFIESISREIVALKNEMRVLQAKPTSQGLKFESPKGCTKDRITSSVLANFAANEVSNILTDSIDQKALEAMLSTGGWI